jgi:hypothetical protein
LDFENPQETMQKLELLRREMERQAQSESAAAQEPQAGIAGGSQPGEPSPRGGVIPAGDKVGPQQGSRTDSSASQTPTASGQQTKSAEKLENPFRR